VSRLPTVPGPVDRAIGRLRELCADAVRTLPADGAGISVLVQAGQYNLMAAADEASERLEEIQFVLGEGPCVEVTRTGRPVLVSDLEGDAARRWPAYATAMREVGIRGVFAFPLQVGGARLGVLDFFRADPGRLSRSELIRAFQLADTAVAALLSLPDGPAQVPAPTFADADAESSELFQAQGMVMVQLDGTLPEAMARIRAHAYAENRRLADVARDIVARRLWFDRDE
jgi:GAF domain-containing protein